MLAVALPSLPTSAALPAAAGFVERLMLGPVATSAAIIAVAMIGLFMLGGRVQYRAAMWVILGAFVLFGAPAIAAGLLALAADVAPRAVPIDIVNETPPQPPASPQPLPVYDPYAGASVPVR